MTEDSNRRFVELWEAFKRLVPSTSGLEVGVGRFVLVPPKQVRLTGFRARLQLTPGGGWASLLVDPSVASMEAYPGPGDAPPIPVRSRVVIDLEDGFVLEGSALKHPTVMARSL